MSEHLVVPSAAVEAEEWSDPVRGRLAFRTLLGGRRAPGDLTAGVAEVPPGGRLGHHRHDPAEVYFVLEGQGVVTVDGVDSPVSADTLVFVPGGSEHAVRNTGVAVLRFFYVFAVDSFDDVEYRFTDER